MLRFSIQNRYIKRAKLMALLGNLFGSEYEVEVKDLTYLGTWGGGIHGFHKRIGVKIYQLTILRRSGNKDSLRD